jgi:hypothetical protein
MKNFVGFFVLAMIMALSASVFGQGGMMGDGMMGQQDGRSSGTPADTAGAAIFRANCVSCHPNGGNTITPNLPLRGSRMLASFDAFLDFIRHPKMPNGSKGAMPNFPPSKISDHQARELYQYLTSAEGSMAGGYSMGPGMMGGYGRGRYGMTGYGMGRYGMMGGYGMGPGMMGPGYSYGSEKGCDKFYNETKNLRKEYYNEKFEYFERIRNPKTTMGEASKLRDQLLELRDNINERNPNNCWW